jgi:hypothetical protein
LANDKRFLAKNGLQAPNISFSSSNSAFANTIVATFLETPSTISFSGNSGQLFSITDSMTGSIYAVNDISGFPSIEVFANGQIDLAPYGGKVVFGNTASLQANGSVGTAGQVLHSNGSAVYWAADDNSGTVTSIATANGLSGGTITTTGTLGVTTGSTLTVNTTGIHVNSALAITSLALSGALSGVTTAAMGNTTITGFANVTSTIQGGSSLTIAGAASGITTLAAGNTTITGFANVSTTLQVGTNTATFGTAAYIVANGNVGIGTTSPTAKLQVQGSIRVNLDNSFLTIDDVLNDRMGLVKKAGSPPIFAAGNASPFVFSHSSAANIADPTNQTYTERMRIDSAGNLGVGVTPSAWNSDYKVFQFGAVASIAGRVGGSNTLDVTSNGFRGADGSWKYIATQPSARFAVDGSVPGFQWYIAASGTAGANISYTQAMTLNSLGQVGIGNTSPAHLLSVQGTAALGNTTITGFANVTSTIQGGSSLAIAGALSGVTTAAMGNTTITGFANVSTTLAVAGISTFSGNVVLGSVGLSANGGFGTAAHVLHSNGTATYWAADDNTTYDLVAVANTAVNAGLLRLTDSSSSNDTVTFTGAGTSNVSSNATHIIINSADQYLGTVTSITAANGLNGGTITSTGTMSVLGGSTLTVNSTGAHVNSALSIASLALSGDLTVSGNLTVSGTRTYVNTTTLDIGDNIFTLNADLGAVAPSQNAGMEIMRGTSANVQFLWDETNDRWSTNGQPIAVSSLVAAGAASGITTLAAGNTTITGFANVTSTIQGGSSLTIAGALSGVTTAAMGNTTITGFANVTSTIQGGSSLTIAGALSGVTTAAMGNTTITGFANVTSTLQVGGVATFAANANFDSGAFFVDGVNNRVGVNTTTPQSMVQVFGSAAPLTGDPASVETMLTLTREGSASVWREGASFALGRWQTGGGSNPFSRLDINLKSVTDNSSLPNVTVMSLQDSGQVGVGTITPQYRLDVNPGLTTNNIAASFGSNITAGQYAGIHFGYAEAANQNYRKSAIVFEREDGSARGKIHILNDGAADGGSAVLSDSKVTITYDGNMGIGTTGPSAKLEVVQNQAAYSYFDFRNQTNGGGVVWRQIVRNIANSGDATVDLAKLIGGGFAINNGDTHASNFTSFSVGASERMRIDASGNMGIGTTSPGARLETYNSTGGTQAIRMNTNFAGGNYIDINPFIAGVSNGGYSISANGVIQMVIAVGGNVGIGTTAPGYKLEVNGSFAATTKSFVIPHPTKPGMKLRYGSLEGPENGVYVRGRLRAGETIIQLPDYWEGLVDQDTYTVNLTPVGKHQELYVKYIADDYIVVGGGGDIDCFYTVFAERNDVEKLEVEF